MKKLISLLLTAAMLLSLCAFAHAEEPVEIRIAVNTLGNGWPADPADDFVYQKILKDIGVSVKFDLVDNFYESMGTRMDVYDMYRIDVDHLISWGRQDLLLDLAPYKDKELAGYFDWLGATQLNAAYVDGTLYGLPQLYDGSKSQLNVTVRQDWLDKLGLKMPETVQDLYDVAYAFTFSDPDGNGQQDTLGLTAQKPGNGGIFLFDTIMGSYDTALGNYILIRDGKVTNALLQPGMLEGLKWCKKFVDAKIVDNDALTTTGTDKFIAGQVGMNAVTWPGIWKQYGQDKIHAVNPDAVTSFFTTLKSEVGAEDAMFTGDLSTTNVIMAINADISEEKLQAVFKYIDYIISDEGSDLIFYGIEGDHWVRDENGNVKMTENATAANYISTYQIFSRKELEYLKVKFPEAQQVFEATTAANRIEIYNTLVLEPEEIYLEDMESYVRQQLLAFIYGERELTQEEYDKFIGELNDNFQFDVYMEAAHDQLAAYGLVD